MYYQPEQPIPLYAHIERTFSRRIPDMDRIVFGLSFLVIVIVCNAVKLAAMITALVVERDKFNVTLGDCAASFLSSPDPWTVGMCMYSKETMIENAKRLNGGRPGANPFGKENESEDPGIWRRQRRSYLASAQPSRSTMPLVL